MGPKLISALATNSTLQWSTLYCLLSANVFTNKRDPDCNNALLIMHVVVAHLKKYGFQGLYSTLL